MKKKATTKKIAEKAKKKEVKKKPKTTPKTAKKTIAKKEPKRIVKKVIAKIKKEPKRIAKKVIAKIEKEPKRIAKKVIARIEKKVPLEAIKKVETRKIAEMPEKKVEAKVEVKKKVYPVKEKYPPTPMEILPTEYGENSITLMTVDPNKLFTYWEVREDTLEIFTGNLNLRVYDVTGVDFDGMNANSYFDIAVNERIGSLYIDVSPEKEFIADIGIIYSEDISITIARSNKVSTPRVTISEEGVLTQKLYETGLRVGY